MCVYVCLINYVLICICYKWRASNTTLHIFARGLGTPSLLCSFLFVFPPASSAYCCCWQYLSKCLTWVTQARTVFVVDTRQGTGRVYLQSQLPLAIQEADKIAISISFSCVYLEANKTARISIAETICHILVMENNSCRVTVMHRRSDVNSCC